MHDDDDDDVDETMIRFHIWQCKSAGYGVGLSLPTPLTSLRRGPRDCNPYARWRAPIRRLPSVSAHCRSSLNCIVAPCRSKPTQCATRPHASVRLTVPQLNVHACRRSAHVVCCRNAAVCQSNVPPGHTPVSPDDGALLLSLLTSPCRLPQRLRCQQI